MAESVFKSPGVSATEIDLTSPAIAGPSGVPAGIIGTSVQGRAFVPITNATFNSFVAEFGESDGTKFGPIAMSEWLTNASAGTFMRVLGAGDGKKRNASVSVSSSWGDGVPSDGGVKNAGFVAGQQLPQKNGELGANAYASTNARQLGRTYLLGAFMSASFGSPIFHEANIASGSAPVGVAGATPMVTASSTPILRGVLMAASGVILALSSSKYLQNSASAWTQGAFGKNAGSGGGDSKTVGGNTITGNVFADGGFFIGSVNVAANAKSEFVMLMNGHTNTAAYPNTVTASFDPSSDSYFPEVFNTDPQKLEKAGHLLYAHYDIAAAYAVVTSSGLQDSKQVPGSVGGSESSANKLYAEAAFLVTSSNPRNSPGAAAVSTAIPNMENFNDRYRTAFSPYITSQKFGGAPENLFRVHALSDGTLRGGSSKNPHIPGSCSKYKISIRNIKKSADPNYKYGSFDLRVRDWNDTDKEQAPLVQFKNLNLDPASENYIARVIGDQNLYFDFDKNDGAQKLVVEGNHPLTNRYIRVEMARSVATKQTDETALPVGFRGPWHLVTSGSSIVEGYGKTTSIASTIVTAADVLRRVIQPPLPFRRNLSEGTGDKKRSQLDFYWGVQFTLSDNLNEPNKATKRNNSIASWTKYFPLFHDTQQNMLVGNNEGVADSGGTVYDADRFNNDRFSLENVQVQTGSDDLPDPTKFQNAIYRRNGVLAAGLSESRFLDVTKDFGTTSVSDLLKFTFFCQAGFDGACAYNKDKADFANAALQREMDNFSTTSGQGGLEGPTVTAYRKAIDIMSTKADVDIKLLAIPGARHSSVTNYAIDAVETRFDAMYIMDVDQRDQIDVTVTSSDPSGGINVANTVKAFQNRVLNTSFAAAYFPDVLIRDPNDKSRIVQVPPSVAALGAFSLNDAVAHPWFAPAGFTRGTMANVTEAKTKLSKAHMDALYDADINPIASFVGSASGVAVWGQKTLLASQSALDRVNVRRLLIEIRRQVKAVGNTLLFEPNRASTLGRFSAAVNPILGQIQSQQGLDRYKVIIDTTTTTQADVENNTIRGKIFLQPTRTLEFISLDFVVTNAGVEV
jgi:hypothetical protein